MNKMRYFESALRMAPRYVRTLSHDSKDNKPSNASLALRWAIRHPIPTTILALAGLGVSGLAIWRLTDEELDIKTSWGSVAKKEKTPPSSQQTLSNNEIYDDSTVTQTQHSLSPSANFKQEINGNKIGKKAKVTQTQGPALPEAELSRGSLRPR